MTNLAKIAKTMPVRAMLVGYPKAGKTGALVSLVNAGFKLRVLDFDGNLDPVLRFADQAMLKNVDAVTLKDSYEMKDKRTGIRGLPTARIRAARLLDHWKYVDDDGEEVDLGHSKDWGPDIIVVLDSLSALGSCSLNLVLSRNSRNMDNKIWNDWDGSQYEQDRLIEELCNKNHHTVIMAHLVMVGPKAIDPKETELNKKLKERTAALVPTRLFPGALGKALSPTISRHTPTLVEVAVKENYAKSTTRRVINTQPRPELDLGVPAPGVPAELPLESGLHTIFSKLGWASPNKE